MKIDPLSPNRPASLRRSNGASATKSGGFAQALEGETTSANPVTGGAGVGAVNALLSIQEIPDPLARRRRATRRGEDLLDQLEDIRLGLLMGALPRPALERLAGFIAAKREEIDDPRLAEVIAEIELRAAVELAKYGG